MVEKEETNLNQDDSNPCKGCTKCCSYVVLEIDKPTNQNDFDNIKWFLLHKNVFVFIDNDNSWNLQFDTPCEKIGKEGWCSYYEKRPRICRTYTTKNCEKYGKGETHKILWKTVDEFENWLKKNKPKFATK